MGVSPLVFCGTGEQTQHLRNVLLLYLLVYVAKTVRAVSRYRSVIFSKVSFTQSLVVAAPHL